MNYRYFHSTADREGASVLSTFVDAISWDDAVARIVNWGLQRESRIVCLCNVHSSVTATKDDTLSRALAKSDLVLPDGAPIAWMLRRKGFPNQTRIAGPDLMARICQELTQNGPTVFLFGSTQNTLERLHRMLLTQHPSLRIAGILSPKYGSWSNEEESAYIDAINQSGAGLVFIGLGCPKQEIWMANNRSRIDGVMLGVGAAFDFHAGTVRRAPFLYQKFGLEWLHRLLSEPRRLWRRYLSTNTRFLWLATKDLLSR